MSHKITHEVLLTIDELRTARDAYRKALEALVSHHDFTEIDAKPSGHRTNSDVRWVNARNVVRGER